MKRSLILHMVLSAAFSISNAMEQSTPEIPTQKANENPEITKLKKEVEEYKGFGGIANLPDMYILQLKLKENGLNQEAQEISRKMNEINMRFNPFH